MGWVSLVKEGTLFVADQRSGAFFKRLNEFGIGEKCGWVELHVRSPWWLVTRSLGVFGF